MKVVYIGGPYRSNMPFPLSILHRAWRIHKARQVARKYWKMGYAVICPHSNSGFMELWNRGDEEMFHQGDFEFIKRCDIFVAMIDWRISVGTNRDLYTAAQYGKDIIYES